MNIEITYLKSLRKTLESHTSTIINLINKYNVKIDKEEAAELIEILDLLKLVLESPEQARYIGVKSETAERQ